MRRLANRIESELKEREICAVYNSELARLWPTTISPAKRKERIKRFAKQHQLAVTFYDVGLCAIFEKPPKTAGGRRLLLPIDGADGDGGEKPRKRRS
jgi:hypothetical protein